MSYGVWRTKLVCARFSCNAIIATFSLATFFLLSLSSLSSNKNSNCAARAGRAHCRVVGKENPRPTQRASAQLVCHPKLIQLGPKTNCRPAIGRARQLAPPHWSRFNPRPDWSAPARPGRPLDDTN